MTKLELWQHDAAGLGDLLASGKTTPIEILETYLGRYDRLNPALNAFVFIDRTGALRDAQLATVRQREGRRLGPMDGLPVAIKDNIFVANAPATWGSMLYQDHVPRQDDICIERLRQAGAIIIGKTATPEFAMSGRTESRLSGVTRNPWDLSLTPGGSSGGAVAAVAAGLVPLAIGTDAGGSARLPASYTGLLGLRSSNGRVPRYVGFPPLALDFQAIGLITRTSRDLRMLFSVLAGADDRDPTSLRHQGARTSARPKAIGWFDHVGADRPDKAVLDAFSDAKAILEQMGFTLEECEPPFDIVAVREVWSTLIAAGAARIADKFSDLWETNMTVPMRDLATDGMTIGAAEYVEALDLLQALRSSTSHRWGRFDVLLSPTGAAPAWPTERECPQMIGGNIGTGAVQSMFCGWVNALGFAGLNVPSTPHPDGRPIGIQLAAREGHDEWLIEIAGALEEASPWSQRWPDLALS